jgi:hypothetical protein
MHILQKLAAEVTFYVIWLFNSPFASSYLVFREFYQTCKTIAQFPVISVKLIHIFTKPEFFNLLSAYYSVSMAASKLGECCQLRRLLDVPHLSPLLVFFYHFLSSPAYSAESAFW